jgi:hypothetical protein
MTFNASSNETNPAHSCARRSFTQRRRAIVPPVTIISPFNRYLYSANAAFCQAVFWMPFPPSIRIILFVLSLFQNFGFEETGKTFPQLVKAARSKITDFGTGSFTDIFAVSR